MRKTTKIVLVALAWVVVSSSRANDGYTPVSLIRLIAVPEVHLDKKVRVRGFFDSALSAQIYLNHLSAEMMDSTSAIDVVDPTPDGHMTISCDKRNVIIEGYFVRHENRYELTNIREIVEIESLKPCWKK